MRRGVFLFLVLMIVLSGFLLWPGAKDGFVEVDIPEGYNGHQAAQLLVQNHCLQSPLPFLVWIRVRGAQSKIHVGRYRFASGRSAFWLVDDIIQGRTEKVRLIIPEGFSSWQIAERISELKICDPEGFKKTVHDQNLEGFLFPATYDLDVGHTVPWVIHRMTSEFDKRWTPAFDQRAKEMGFSKLNVVTLASIIEREARFREELPLIAVVYQNRLRRKMPLQADPTVEFALGNWKVHLTYNDYYHTQSPYNTYLTKGLPPGAICSPGLDAIKAVLWPATSDALYFVATEDGHHSFSTSYREHTNKVNKRNKTARLKRN